MSTVQSNGALDLNYMFAGNGPTAPSNNSQGQMHGLNSQTDHMYAPHHSLHPPAFHYPHYDHNYAINNTCDPEVYNKLSNLERENAALHSKMDTLLKMVNEIKYESYTACNFDEDINQYRKDLPLKDVAGVKTLEKRLCSSEYFNRFKKVLRLYLGNRNEIGSGANNAYILVDKVFERNLLMSYTWTGSSKTTEKLAFIKLKNIVRVFFEAIYAVDNSFGLKDVEIFFQNKILKYSKTRLNGNKIKPSCRNRKKTIIRTKKIIVQM